MRQFKALNRRLTLATEELAGSDSRVIDIALKYGYESPEAFAKAFQRIHGVTPLAAKKKNVKLKAFPRLSFQIQIKGETEMNYRIVEEKAFKDFREDGTRHYLFGTVLPDGNAVPSEFTMLSIPDQTYAVFDSREKVPESEELGLEVENVWKRIYSE
ncbi:helix-turn-helix domain-containing protein [Paenibacillus sp. J5C_2022]|uniref:helix-turn-helix domain-containing protein n=1 Tax=Paenibacillus sp. J5C2022 TaxID=2977129 RepID=UPI0021D1252F|nr:helix-turn-helix domain-containing protein [Paenibacillus sp. J5C2022]MCU6711055.1 helix-turn-helix domain-containing protein [Paenibacillus sp. J5C2022]